MLSNDDILGEVLFPSEEKLSPSELKKRGIRLSRHDSVQRLYSLDEVAELLKTKKASRIDPTQQSKGSKKHIDPVDKCDVCPLKGHQTVEMSGDKKTAKILFVGEAPGAHEDFEGKPFVGQAGKLLRSIINQVGINEEDCAFTNVVKCRPPTNRTPSLKEIDCCKSRLLSDLEGFNGLVVCLGAVPLSALLRKEGVKNYRGYGFFDRGLHYFITYHPAYILRNPEAETIFTSDLKKVHSFAYVKKDLKPIVLDVIGAVQNFCSIVWQNSVDLSNYLLSCDVETTSLDPASGKILSIAFSDGTNTWCIPMGCKDSPLIDNEVITILEKGIFSNPRVKLVMHNSLFDLSYIKKQYGIQISNLFMDTMFAHFVLEGKYANHSLKPLAWKYTDFGGYDVDREKMEELSYKDLLEYNGWDALVTAKLASLFLSRLSEPQKVLITQIIALAMMAISEIKVEGIRLDKKLVVSLAEKYGAEVSELENKLRSYSEVQDLESPTGAIFNFNSPKQLLGLFSKLGIDSKKLTRGGGSKSTDNEVLTELKDKHPIINTLLQYREKEKVLTTYLTPYRTILENNQEFIYGDYSFIRTFTGRLSCSNPNFQNIPEEVRAIFISRFGYLMGVDFSQIELRVLACYCFDEKMISAFRNDEDIHARVGEEIFGKSKLTKAERTQVKAVNFGTVYGITSYGLAKDLGCSETEAEAILKRFYSKFPKVKDFQEGVKDFVLKHGYYETYFGRKRWFSFAASMSAEERNSQLRQAVNFPIQGTASDLVQDATGRTWKKMREGHYQSLLVGHVHDELLLDVPDSELEKMIELVKTETETFSFDWVTVPIKVNIKIGANWKDSEELVL
jgi:uracil-DNA glycosylase family 4